MSTIQCVYNLAAIDIRNETRTLVLLNLFILADSFVCERISLRMCVCVSARCDGIHKVCDEFIENLYVCSMREHECRL